MDSIHQTNEQLEKIANIIEDITEKAKVINDISFQTKILSFNTSIEAVELVSMVVALLSLQRRLRT